MLVFEEEKTLMMEQLPSIFFQLDGIAPMITDPQRTSSTTLSHFVKLMFFFTILFFILFFGVIHDT